MSNWHVYAYVLAWLRLHVEPTTLLRDLASLARMITGEPAD